MFFVTVFVIVFEKEHRAEGAEGQREREGEREITDTCLERIQKAHPMLSPNSCHPLCAEDENNVASKVDSKVQNE